MGLYSAKDVAEKLGKCKRTIINRAQRHKIGKLVGRQYVFEDHDIELLKDVIQDGAGNPQFGKGYVPPKK